MLPSPLSLSTIYPLERGIVIYSTLSPRPSSISRLIILSKLIHFFIRFITLYHRDELPAMESATVSGKLIIKIKFKCFSWMLVDEMVSFLFVACWCWAGFNSAMAA